LVALKIALVDDEREYLSQMGKICRDYNLKCGADIEIYSFSDAETFLIAASETEFPIVFMDIYMSGIDGISAARRLRERYRNCVIVFFTASGEFMPEAFSCHAFEYLSKPIERERVEKCLDDAIKVLLPPAEYIEIASERKTALVYLRDIVFVVTDAHYLEICLTDGAKLPLRVRDAGRVEQAVSRYNFDSIRRRQNTPHGRNAL